MLGSDPLGDVTVWGGKHGPTSWHSQHALCQPAAVAPCQLETLLPTKASAQQLAFLREKNHAGLWTHLWDDNALQGQLHIQAGISTVLLSRDSSFPAESQPQQSFMRVTWEKLFPSPLFLGCV